MLGEQILNVSVAQRKAQVEPHSALDDNRRRAVTEVRISAIEPAYPRRLSPAISLS
jgi:hypothetical protein